MKRVIIIFFGLVCYTQFSNAQNEVDALRYSQQFISGTARSLGMGGAMGAIGGDMSSVSINPAGLGIYRGSEFTFTPDLNWNTTSSDFLGNKIDQTRYGFNIANIGYVANNDLGHESGWVSTSFGIGYTMLNNFNQKILMSGTNTKSSLLDNFVNHANNPYTTPDNLDPFYEQLAYDVFILPLDTTTSPWEYWNDFQNNGYGELQQRDVRRSGTLGEYSFSFAGNYSNKLYLGAAFNLQRAKYESHYFHTESDNNPNDFIQKFTFTDNLNTQGYGINGKLGLIYRPLDFLRIGASYQMPTFFFMHDYYSTSIDAYYDSGDPSQSKSSPRGDFKYQIRTPGKIIGSVAAIFGKVGLLSLDYEYTDFSKANMESDNYGFINENNAIKNDYKAVSNIRAGGEVRLGPAYLRAGYGFYGSPYVSSDPKAKASHSIISGGVGIRNSDFFLDIGYAKQLSKQMYYMYVPEMTQGSLNSADLNSLLVTVGFRF